MPVLKRLDAQGRLLWYDLSTSKQRHGPGPVVRAAAFSAEAALNLLALAGVTKVRSLGIDGGNAYGSAFDDLKDQTRLNNGQPSYDLQFQGFARTISSTGVDYAPLDIESPIRVYVGSQEEQMLSVRVLEHSIRRHASMSVQVQPLHTFDIPFRHAEGPEESCRARRSRSSASRSRRSPVTAAARSISIRTCRSSATSAACGRCLSTARNCWPRRPPTARRDARSSA